MNKQQNDFDEKLQNNHCENQTDGATVRHYWLTHLTVFCPRITIVNPLSVNVAMSEKGIKVNVCSRGKKIKGSGEGEGNQGGKKEKKRKFGENITFDSTKS